MFDKWYICYFLNWDVWLKFNVENDLKKKIIFIYNR